MARQARAQQYLQQHIRYDLDEEARRGLATYLDLAVELGLAPGPAPGHSWVGTAPAVSARA